MNKAELVEQINAELRAPRTLTSLVAHIVSDIIANLIDCDHLVQSDSGEVLKPEDLTGYSPDYPVVNEATRFGEVVLDVPLAGGGWDSVTVRDVEKLINDFKK